MNQREETREEMNQREETREVRKGDKSKALMK
jgi:hypothetical protein